jgi:hypothetical protein
MKNYDDFKGRLTTFDTLCCVQDSWIMKPIGHTAMVVRDLEKAMLWVWQSTTLYGGYKGTSLTPLRPWLEQYPGKVYVRQLEFVGNNSFGKIATAEYLLDKYIAEHRGAPYPDLQATSGLWYMVRSVLHLGKPNQPPVPDALQCAGRWADTFQKCGLIIPECNTSEVEPDEVRDYMIGHTPIDRMLVSGVILKNEVRIK